MRISRYQTLMLLGGQGVIKELADFGREKRDNKMIAQAAQLNANGYLVDAALVASTIFCAVGWFYSNNATRYYICSALAAGSTTLVLYGTKKMYDSACYVQNAMNMHPALYKRIIKKWGIRG